MPPARLGAGCPFRRASGVSRPGPPRLVALAPVPREAPEAVRTIAGRKSRVPECASRRRKGGQRKSSARAKGRKGRRRSFYLLMG